MSRTEIRFTPAEKAALVGDLRHFFSAELDEDLGQFPAERLLAFITERVGGYYYNRGLYDARAILAARVDDLTDAIHALEQPTGFGR